jgi:hypothetical protein
LQIPMTGRPSNRSCGHPWFFIQLRWPKPSRSFFPHQPRLRSVNFVPSALLADICDSPDEPHQSQLAILVLFALCNARSSLRERGLQTETIHLLNLESQSTIRAFDRNTEQLARSHTRCRTQARTKATIEGTPSSLHRGRRADRALQSKYRTRLPQVVWFRITDSLPRV